MVVQFKFTGGLPQQRIAPIQRVEGLGQVSVAPHLKIPSR